jgi:glycine/D-amino acid oxidase-like deaminating enzyme
VIGATVALRLAQSGAAVTLLDRAQPAAGTSGTTFAWVNASSKEPRPYFELNNEGVAAHARLAAELGEATWRLPTGKLEWDATPAGAAALAARARRLMDWGYAVRHLTRAAVERLEPDLLPGPEVDEAFFFPDESVVFPSLYLARVLRAARGCGAAIRVGAEVAEIVTASGRAAGVALRGGERLPADVVLCCCGRWTPDLLRSVGTTVPLVPWAQAGSEAVGLLVSTTPVPADIGRAVAAGGLDLRPDGGGRLLLHGDAFDRQTEIDMPEPERMAVAAALLEAARPLVRYTQGAAIASIATGIRPIPADGVSVVGWIPGVEGVYAIVTHSGITLAPALAEMAAREVYGADEAMLAPFRAARFAG